MEISIIEGPIRSDFVSIREMLCSEVSTQSGINPVDINVCEGQLSAELGFLSRD